MLQVAYIRENKERVLKGLAVRNFKDAESQVDQVVELDDQRKQLQQQHDQVHQQAGLADQVNDGQALFGGGDSQIRHRRYRVAIDYYDVGMRAIVYIADVIGCLPMCPPARIRR